MSTTKKGSKKLTPYQEEVLKAAKQIKEYNEKIEKEMAEKKAAYQSGEAYRRGSEDIIDVDYVEKEEK